VQTNEVTREKLRELAALRAGEGRVLSLYLDLDPSTFGTEPARATAVTSLLDEARRLVDDTPGLSHDALAALRADVERAREFFASYDFAKGAHGVALFSSQAVGLFEPLKLPRTVEPLVVIDDSPYVEPLLDVSAASWCVLLSSRRSGRILRGSAERLDEVARVSDEVHGRHSQGGWSQARYQRSIEREAENHVQRVADAVFRGFRRSPFDHLLIGAAEELMPEIEDALHSYVRKRLVGRFDVDVEHSTAEDVRAAAAPLMDAQDRLRERVALDRLAEGLGSGGRAAAGFAAVLDALHQRRVEILLFERGLSTAGTVCPACGWMSADSATRCPVDEETLQARANVVETAVECALSQSAEVIPVRHHADLGPHGRIGAVLRF
jgi:peptide subunit release factor 1 (eRF1)